MKRVLDFLKKAEVYYLATVEGDQPRVRPFGTINEFEGKLDTEPLITHTYPLSQIDEAYELFENKCDGVIKVAIEC